VAAPVREEGMSEPLVQWKGLQMRFGGLVAVDGFDERVEYGELLGLIGPNGAGKTTIFNVTTGVYRPTEGDILFRGQSIKGKPPHLIISGGIARTFQNIRLFNNLSVLDNVRLACHHRVRYGLIEAVFRVGRFRPTEKEMERRSRELLALFDLEEKADWDASSLPYGEQRRLEIARALAIGPELLMLDEPAAGMNPQEKDALAGLIERIRKDFSLTILLIEHDMPFVMGLCERIVVLDYGKIISRGTPEQVRSDPEVIRAYLGDAASA
jgi:branched-chain amino acid transport system ATP-binding protein